MNYSDWDIAINHPLYGEMSDPHYFWTCDLRLGFYLGHLQNYYLVWDFAARSRSYSLGNRVFIFQLCSCSPLILPYPCYLSFRSNVSAKRDSLSSRPGL